MYIAGVGVEKDPKAAFQWFERGARAENVECMFQCGRLLEERAGNRKAARLWYEKAAAGGHEKARRRLQE